MKRFVRILVVAAIILLAAIASAAADQGYTDPSGDGSPGNLDITSVTVRNDESGGISIQVGTANPVVGYQVLFVDVDSDRNQATGSVGVDYYMLGGPLVGSTFFCARERRFAPCDPPSFRVVIVAPNVTEFRFNKTDIGGVAGFNFRVRSVRLDPDLNDHFDGAPDRGYWSYDLTVPAPTPTPTPAPAAVKPVIGAALATPAQPVAGKTMVVQYAVTRSDTGAPLTGATMTCDPSIAGKAIKHKESLKNGTARLSFLVPKTAKGKTLKVKVKITAGTESATRVTTFRVR